MRSKFVQKLIAVGTSAALACSTCGVGAAFAFQETAYDVPTQPTPVVNADGYRYVSAVGQHGSAVVGEYAGMNELVNEIFATPGNGTSTKDYMYNPYMGIFGTSANENPDPYTANLMYNWYAEEKGLDKTSDAMVNLLFTSSKGSSILSDTSVSPSGTSYTLAGRPDVLTVNPAAKHQFASQIETINKEDKIKASDTYVGDAKYDPITATYDEKNVGTQIANMWRHSKSAVKVEEDAKADGLKIVTRYGDSLETAYKYELYTKGSILYTLSQLKENGGTVDKKTIAYVKGISGNDKNATVTLYGEPDPSVSREMAHHIECTVATANNLANIIDPDTVAPGGVRPSEVKAAKTTCTIEQLAQADVIILADPDNMAYNLSGQDEQGQFVGPNWVKSDDKGTAENNWGQSATRSAVGTDGKTVYKNRFWGPMASTHTMTDSIKAALNDLGTDKAKALAAKNILSCVQEGSSSSDGGSTEAMSQYGIVNAFVYPEIASGLNQYAWWLDNISHIKTDKVAGMVRILCQDMSLADGAALTDVDDWSATKSNDITAKYEAGITYYNNNKADIDSKYPWLTPTEDFTSYKATGKPTETAIPRASEVAAPIEEEQPTTPTTEPTTDVTKTQKDQTITVKTTAKTVKAKKLKKKAVSFNINAKASTDLTYKVTKKNAKIKFSKGKVTVKKGTKKGDYAITVKITAKKSADFKAATKNVDIKVTVK